MLVCSLVKLLPLGIVDDLMDYFTRPSALCNGASGRPRHLGIIGLTIHRHEITVYYPGCEDMIEKYVRRIAVLAS